MTRARTPSLAVLIAGIVVGCGGSAPSASLPAPTTASVDLPIAADWSAEPVDPVDPVAYRAAAAAAGLTIGDRTVWTRTAEEHWLPAEPIEPIDRVGIVAWHRGLVGWTFGPVITTSPDGVAWTQTAPGPPEQTPTVLATVLDRLLLFGEGARTPAGAWTTGCTSVYRNTADRAFRNGLRPGASALTQRRRAPPTRCARAIPSKPSRPRRSHCMRIPRPSPW